MNVCFLLIGLVIVIRRRRCRRDLLLLKQKVSPHSHKDEQNHILRCGGSVRTGAASAIDFVSVSVVVVVESVPAVAAVFGSPVTASFALPNKAAASSVTLDAASEIADVTCSVVVAVGFVSSVLIT